jgi:hypothetical protein
LIRGRHSEPHDTEPRFCIIGLEAEGIDLSRLRISVYSQEGSQPADPILPPDDHFYTEDEICVLIGLALDTIQLTGGHPANLRIEFFLPPVLLNLPVDQWRVGEARITLGVQYEVVIRSLTRLRDLKRFLTYWEDKWARLLREEFHGTDEFEWLTEEDADRDSDRIFVRLIEADGPVCLLLKDPPVPDHCQALLVALTAGVPVLMWSRHPRANLGDGLSDLHPKVHPRWLIDLPRQVLTWRRAWAKRGVGSDHLAKNLTLLYDAADRNLFPAFT